MNQGERNEQITVRVEDELLNVNNFLLHLDDWSQLPAAGDAIEHPDTRLNFSEERRWIVRKRVYQTRLSEKKVCVDTVILLCDFDDPSNQGTVPFSNFESDPICNFESDPNPHLFSIPDEYADAVLVQLQELAKQAISKRDWSSVFQFLSRLPSEWSSSKSTD